jgi:hypothetical protein
MFGRRLLALVLVISFAASGSFDVARPVAASQSAECVQLAWYAGEMTAAGKRIDAEEENGPDMEHVESWTAADFDAAIALYDGFLTMLQGIDPPPVAAAYHQTFIEGVELLQEMVEIMQTSGLLAMMGYLEPIDAVYLELATLSLPLEMSCQVALFDHDEDGVLEVGPGNAPASPEGGGAAPDTAPEADGSRVNPIPLGTPAKLDDRWELTVLSVTPDATAEVLAYDPSNTAPADGSQYFMARVRITNSGSDDDSFNGWRLSLEDPSGRSYSPFIDFCGFIPDELPIDTLTSGSSAEGNVCWAIPSVEAASTAALVLYDGDAFENERIYFSLNGPAS